MNGYMSAMNGNPVLSPAHSHSVPSGQNSNSLQGALKTGPEPMKRTPSTTSKSPHLASQAVVAEAKAKAASTNNASLDQDMQRQLADYNRSVTVVVWYRPNTEPIRLQHMNPTFPYFQLLQLEMLVADLALTPNSFIDTFDPQSGTWEQHNMNTVRIVSTQQRLLYKIRRSLLEGLSERECPGLHEEVASQTTAQKHLTSPNLPSKVPSTPASAHTRKRSAPDDAASEAPAQKAHVPNHYYSAHTHAAPPTTLPRMPTTVSEPIDVMYVNGSYPSYTPQQMYYSTSTPAHTSTHAHAHTHAPAPVHVPAATATPVSVGQPASTTASASTSASAPARIPDSSPPPSPSPPTMPNANVNAIDPSSSSPPPPLPPPLPLAAASGSGSGSGSGSASSAPIPTVAQPSAPHPPAKRWPNDYTVAELTEGFRAMEALVQNGSSGTPGAGAGAGARSGSNSNSSSNASTSGTSSGSGGSMTQRAAFERVFGTRYVKSTVCRHRGLWRKAAGPLREQFERMGTDERACWNEFVRRVEGRPPGKAAGAAQAQVSMQMSVSVPVPMPMQQVPMQVVYPGPPPPAAVPGSVASGGTEPRAPTEVGAAPEEPVMASLQAPDGQSAGFG